MARRPDRPPIGSSARAGGGPPSVGRVRTTGRRGRTPQDLPPFTRPALAPSLLAAVVLLACIALIDSGGFLYVRWAVTVLALVVLVFAVRGRSWVSVPLVAAIAVLWNPVVRIAVPGEVWAGLQLLAAVVFIVVGILVRVPRTA